MSKETSEESLKKTFKVKDNRRFESDGSEKSNSSSEPDPSFEKGFILKDASPVTDRDPNADEDGHSATEVNFVSFMMSLATQGMMQLGEMPPPEGHEVAVDLENAKQTIDILAMLQEKTRGNLDEFETGLVEEILHTLRMAYVAKSK